MTNETVRRRVISKRVTVWFTAISTVLVLWGVVFAFFGLGFLPVKRQALVAWESALYGAIMMGWGLTLCRADCAPAQRP
jgi:hypothetical protein